MISYLSKRFLIFIIVTTILILCLSSSSSIQTFFGIRPPSIETQYSSILGPNTDKLPTQDEAIQLFQLWKKENGRVYNDLEEMAKKFDIFVSNLKYITESNAKRESSQESFLGLTNFADWSAQEFKNIYLHDIDMPINNVMKMDDDNITVSSSSIDWRSRGAVTPIKNQGICGSCWAFSATGAIEGIHQIKSKDKQLISLSEQELLDCAESKGCDGGWADKSFDWVKRNGGIGSGRDYPYYEKKMACKASKTKKRATIDGYHQVTPGSEKELWNAAGDQPVSVYINALEDFHLYKGNIYYGRHCPGGSSTTINHAVLIVGYSSLKGEDYWIVKNSWGKKWGIDGYIWIKRNTGTTYGVCAINAWAYYPIKNASATI